VSRKPENLSACFAHLKRKYGSGKDLMIQPLHITGNLFLDRSILQERNGGGGTRKTNHAPQA